MTFEFHQDKRFGHLGDPRRIWAVSAIHAEAGRLMDIHDTLFERIAPGDRLVYLGNYMGAGPHPVETVDEILTFRRMVLALPGMMPEDVIYLRGGQEEMWQKLLHIQFAQDAGAVLEWMLGKGLHATLESYGISPQQGLTAAREGVMSLTKWTNKIRDAVRRRPGHEIFSSQWRRAAMTATQGEYPMLFVHAGINPDAPLHDQGDSFWWAGKTFNDITLPYDPFRKVVRGFDPNHSGLHLNCVTATIDGGCGFGGNLVCAGFNQAGELFDLIEA